MHDVSEDPVSQSPSRIWNGVRSLLRFGMWFCIFTYLLSFFGKLFFVAELLTNFRFHFLVLFVFLVLLSRLVKASRFLVVCLVLATIWTGWESGRIYLPAVQPLAGDQKIRVMSYNVLATNWEFQPSIDEVRLHDPDVVAVLEYANMWHQSFDALNDDYPYQHRAPRWHGYGVAIFSKFPLVDSESVQLTEDEIDNPAAVMTMQIGDKKLRLVAVHVMSPTNRFRLELRNRQFEEIAAYINAESVDTILVGDMNCTPSSYYLSDLIRETGLRDSRQGFGRQPSWPRWAPPLAVSIDHVLVSDSIHVHDRLLGASRGSDHRPVIVDVSIGKPK